MSKCLLSMTALFLLLPVPLQAQTGGSGIGGGGGGMAGAPDRRQMEEDIEIMRRLLSRALAGQQLQNCVSCHAGINRNSGPGGSITFNPDGRLVTTDLTNPHGSLRIWDVATGKQLSTHPAISHNLGSLGGVYLKGCGVVYTMTLPPSPQATKATFTTRTKKALSDWERVRKEIRGDKTEGAPPTTVAPPSLADVILRVLAQNGRHFTQLGANEKLTVAVTFREPQQGTGAGGATGMGSAGPGMGGMPMGPGGMMGSGSGGKGGGLFSPGGGMPGMMMPGAGPGSMQLPSTVRDNELAGDLHLKQNHVGAALTAYKNALDILSKVSGPASDAQRRTIYWKLARAYLGTIDQVGDQKKQQQVVDRAIEFLRNAQHPKGGELPTASTHLPARLIVSAPKALLDQVGLGKITFEEFRRAASVESVPATTVSQQPASKPR